MRALPRPRVVFDGTRPRRPWDRYSCLTLSLFLGGGGLLAALLFGAAFLPLGSPAQLGCGLLCGGLGALLLRSRRQAAPAEDEAPAQRATRVALETVLLLGTLRPVSALSLLLPVSPPSKGASGAGPTCS